MKKSASTGPKSSLRHKTTDDTKPPRPVLQYLQAWTHIVRPYASKSNPPWESRSPLPEHER
jgi:hypothetical protein